MGSALSEVSERAALHVDESALAGGVHDLQDELAEMGIGGDEVEVVVVFAGEWMHGGVEAVAGESHACGF